jgi:glycosyltransferase involved in cell wall biosynthesis
MSRVRVILPALDEADALPHALAGRPADVEVLVVDNGSSDGTAEVARQLGVEVVAEPRRGFGGACWRGAQETTDAEVLVFMDADGSLTWDDLPAVTGPVLSGRADLAVGHRCRQRREPGAMPWHAVAANGALGRLCGLLAGTRLRDIGPYRAIRRDVLLDLGVADRTYGWPLEMVLRAGRRGLRIVEVPVTYRQRAAGRSKVTGRVWPTVKTGGKMGWVLLRHAATVRGGAR